VTVGSSQITARAPELPDASAGGWRVSDVERLVSPPERGVVEVGPSLLNYAALDLDEGRQRVSEDGYVIVRDLLPAALLSEIRTFWLSGPFRESSALPRVTWSPFLGQQNTVGYSQDAFQCMWRSCDFLWNEPFHGPTRDVCIRLNSLRNLLLGLDPLLGVRYASDRYGIFVTTTYYPAGSGFMDMHADGVGGAMPLLHHIAPLTFKGIDYELGGMQLIDRRGKTIDVDGLLKPGDVVFYDGALKHGVATIGAKAGASPLGRLQMFAIPTRFENVERNREIADQMPLKTFLAARWRSLRNKISVQLGLKQIVR
jgi:hypothetical protein